MNNEQETREGGTRDLDRAGKAHSSSMLRGHNESSRACVCVCVCVCACACPCVCVCMYECLAFSASLSLCLCLSLSLCLWLSLPSLCSLSLALSGSPCLSGAKMKTLTRQRLSAEFCRDTLQLIQNGNSTAKKDNYSSRSLNINDHQPTANNQRK